MILFIIVMIMGAEIELGLLCLRNNLDVRELAIQFGCVRLIPFVKKGFSL